MVARFAHWALGAVNTSDIWDQVPRQGVGLAIILLVVGFVIGLMRKIIWLILVAAGAGIAIAWFWASGQHALP